MIKKILILILMVSALLNAKSIEDKIIEAYKTGHQQGVNQIEREFDLQGWEEKKINPKKYIVSLDISNIPQNEILLYKNYAFFEGLLPMTAESPTKSIIIFASYNRKVDAQSLAKELNKKIPLVKYVVKVGIKEQGIYIKKPFIYKYLFDKMLKKIKDSVKGKVYIIKEKVLDKPIVKIVKVKTKKKTTLVKKIYQPMYAKIRVFSYEGTYLKYTSKKWKDEKFVFKKFLLKDKNIESYNMVTTLKGQKYIKIANKNLYVEEDYVKQIK